MKRKGGGREVKDEKGKKEGTEGSENKAKRKQKKWWLKSINQ